MEPVCWGTPWGCPPQAQHAASLARDSGLPWMASALCSVPGRRQSRGNTASLILNCPSWLATDDSRINEGQQRGIGSCQIWVWALGPLTFLWLWEASGGGATGRCPRPQEASLLLFSMGISPVRLMGAPRPLQPPFLSSPAGPRSLGSGVEPGGWSRRGDTGLGGQRGAGAWFSRAVRIDSRFLSVTQEQLETGHHGSTDTQQSPAKGPG